MKTAVAIWLGLNLVMAVCRPAVGQTDDHSMESGIRLEAFVDQTSVPLNRTIKFTIRLQWQGNLDRYDIHHFDNPIVENLEIIGNASANKVGEENGQAMAVQEYEYTLKPKSMGMGYVEGMIINYTDVTNNKEFRLITQRMEVKAIDPLPEPGSKKWVLYLALILLASAAMAVLFIIIKKKKAAASLKKQEAATVQISLEEQFLLTLKNEVNLADPDLDLDASYGQVSRLLRRFLNQKFNIAGLEATTVDVLRSLEQIKVDDRFISDIRDVLTSADLVKFSGTSIERSEFERCYTLVEALLQRSLRGEIQAG
jgi:hypothetical protein